MILLWGVPSDSPTAAIRAALERRGSPAFFLDQTRAAEMEVEWTSNAGVRGRLTLGDAVCDLAELGAIYARPYATRDIAPGIAHADQLDAALYDFLDLTSARVVNPLAAMAANGSKPYQLALIAAQGFAVPDTLVTTDPAAVLGFQARHGQIVYKSVSGIRSIVRRFSAADSDRLADIAWCPTQFQQYVPGRDYRVHVVGHDVFAAEIVSDADDYRYASAQGETVDIVASRLPEPLERACRALAGSMDLAVAGIDLRLTPGGAWFCFEVNPSPAFTYYESATGHPIADSVAGLLDGKGSWESIV